jgi:TDG/mug DNA glycosylase family protein
MGDEVETLTDLFPSEPRAVCIGIKPAPMSVAAGHDYRGREGQRFFSRLRQAGILSSVPEGFEDDGAFADGIGFTDVVKRPTARADELTTAEKRYGTKLLAEKLKRIGAPALIFSFNAATVE